MQSVLNQISQTRIHPPFLLFPQTGQRYSENYKHAKATRHHVQSLLGQESFYYSQMCRPCEQDREMGKKALLCFYKAFRSFSSRRYDLKWDWKSKQNPDYHNFSVIQGCILHLTSEKCLSLKQRYNLLWLPLLNDCVDNTLQGMVHESMWGSPLRMCCLGFVSLTSLAHLGARNPCWRAAFIRVACEVVCRAFSWLIIDVRGCSSL